MSTASAQIGDWLGIEPPMTQAAVLELVEQQLAPPVIQRLLDMGLSRDEVYSVIIPARTLQHRRSRHERLTIEESDRVIRALRVLSAAEGVYESRERALQWLRRPNPRLNTDIYLTPPNATGCGLTKVANGAGSVCTAC